jgi:hypothetical protein
MDVYLTEEELEREKHLFAPHEISYIILDVKVFDARSYKEQVAEGEDIEQAPLSC